MPPLTQTLLLWSFAYLAGSISTAVIVCRLFGIQDPRKAGSHNAGATNVLRLGGRIAGLLTLTGDVLKGILPPLLCLWLQQPVHVIAGAAVAVVAGHILPVFYGFHGGKGVATTLGVLLVWDPGALGVFAVAWMLTAILFRYSSLASIVAMSVATLWVLLFSGHWPVPWYEMANAPRLPWDVYALAVMPCLWLLIVAKHHQNLRNLWQGREPKIGRKTSP